MRALAIVLGLAAMAPIFGGATGEPTPATCAVAHLSAVYSVEHVIEGALAQGDEIRSVDCLPTCSPGVLGVLVRMEVLIIVEGASQGDQFVLNAVDYDFFGSGNWIHTSHPLTGEPPRARAAAAASSPGNCAIFSLLAAAAEAPVTFTAFDCNQWIVCDKQLDTLELALG